MCAEFLVANRGENAIRTFRAYLSVPEIIATAQRCGTA